MKTYLVVGQGLAGSFLAWQLLQRGQNVTVVDDHHRRCASFSAAGMVNPITGKRLVLSDQCAELLPFARSFYQELERFFRQEFFVATDIIRIFQSPAEHNEWTIKSRQPHGEKYYGRYQPPGVHGAAVRDPLGSFLIRQGGYCHKERLLRCLTEFFRQKEILREERLDYQDLILTEEGARWKGKVFSCVIFCEGYQIRGNPFFSWIPFKPAKGEILNLRIESSGIPRSVLSGGKWLIPLIGDQWTVGSTYHWDRLDEEPTVKGKNEILEGLRRFVNVQARVTGHAAGVRPITRDRFPCLGRHPAHPQLAVFNGLASKGLLWGPFYAVHMAEHLLHSVPLEKRVAIGRFQRKWFVDRRKMDKK